MERRSATVEDTRRRIVEATVELHNEKGVSGTSMQDIAERSGVALATVYRHFPTLDALVPACAARNIELNPLPEETVFAGLDGGDARIAAVVAALFAHYERGRRAYEVGFAEAVTLPVMARLMAGLGAGVRELVAASAQPFEPDDKHLSLAVGLCDFRVWCALTDAGLSTADAAELTSQLVASAFSGKRRR